jgi:hypothetical protein
MEKNKIRLEKRSIRDAPIYKIPQNYLQIDSRDIATVETIITITKRMSKSVNGKFFVFIEGVDTQIKHYEESVSCCTLQYKVCTKKWFSNACRASYDYKLVNYSQTRTVCSQGESEQEP